VRLSLSLSETETNSVIWTDRVTSPFDELVDRIDEAVSRKDDVTRRVRSKIVQELVALMFNSTIVAAL
jgi:hypothetical protein